MGHGLEREELKSSSAQSTERAPREQTFATYAGFPPSPRKKWLFTVIWMWSRGSNGRTLSVGLGCKPFHKLENGALKKKLKSNIKGRQVCLIRITLEGDRDELPTLGAKHRRTQPMVQLIQRYHRIFPSCYLSSARPSPRYREQLCAANNKGPTPLSHSPQVPIHASNPLRLQRVITAREHLGLA